MVDTKHKQSVRYWAEGRSRGFAGAWRRQSVIRVYLNMSAPQTLSNELHIILEAGRAAKDPEPGEGA